MKFIERFESLIHKNTPTGCWWWVGERSPFGHGVFRIGKTYVFAHRLSYEIYTGQIENGLHVCHSCDVPYCVNPAHLWLGTHAEGITQRALSEMFGVSQTQIGRLVRGESRKQMPLDVKAPISDSALN